jgi:hypothetical protein
MMTIDDDDDDDDDDYYYYYYYYYYYKYTDKVGTFESHRHSSKCSVVHSGEYSITANLREEI